MRPILFLTFALAVLFLGSCTKPVETSGESTLEMCQDGVDNDANGDKDCDDSGCSAFCVVDPVGDDVIGAPIVKYSYGLQPSQVNFTRLQTMFQNWLANHYEEDLTLNQARIRFQNQSGVDMNGIAISRDHTVSEGIAYGMVILAGLDATPDRLKRLWNYYNAHLDSKGLMHWMVYKFEPGYAKGGAASDAELDAAMALLLAQKKWGDAEGTTYYLDEAKALLLKIREHEIAEDLTLYPGDGWGRTPPVRNPGYASVGAMHAFANATGITEWHDIAQANYDMITRCQNPENGVIPDWCDNSTGGQATTASQKSRDFNLESVRMPWRLALDYYWYGSEEAKTISKKFSDYLLAEFSGDVGRLGQGISWTGSQIAGDMKPSFRGTYALLLSHDATQQANVDYLYGQLTGVDNTGYYESSLQLMFAATLAGYLPKPY